MSKKIKKSANEVAKYAINRGCCTLWIGSPVITGSRFRTVAITSNNPFFNIGEFQVYMIAGTGDGLVTNVAVITLHDECLNGYDAAAMRADELVRQCQEAGFKL